MANRLRPVLDEIISPSQSAFIPGRMITDNALMAFECIYALQTNNNKAGEFCAYKLDLSKAYDRVDWTFLERSMRRLGFADKWIDWIMACVTSVRYAVRLNGSLLEAFHPTRGLRQGDPLSPYLFLLVAEGLSVLIDHEIRESRMKELKICRRAPGLSHLLFADDSLLFFEAKKEQAEIVKKILGKYERGTGQLLSPSKCSILLGNKVKEEDGQQTLLILNIEKAEFEEKYLGLPVPEGRMKNGQFEPTKDCIRKYMNDWCEKYMSSGAKETLIKSVVQAVSTYAMSIFKFSAGLCDEFSQITRNFWWGDELDRKKTHWKAWEKIIAPKYFGGLGFRDYRLFNQALLARQAWRLLAFPNSLCARLLKAKYYPNGELTDTAFIQNSSPGWQGVCHGLELLKKGVIWRVQDGSKIRIWRDNWIPRGNLKASKKIGKGRQRWVSDLIDKNSMTWKEDLIRSLFPSYDAEEILRIRLPHSAEEDYIAWHHDKTGIFTVRSAYRFALLHKSEAFCSG
jgi:hypothetical protein